MGSSSAVWQKPGIQRRKAYSEIERRLTSIIFIWCLMAFSISHVESEVLIAADLSPDFSTHSIVRPQLFHAKNNREIIDTSVNNFDHVDDLTIKLDIDGIQQTLDLYLNKDLIPLGYRHGTHYGDNHRIEIPQRVELCHYQGSIRGIAHSRLALSTCRGLRGIIDDSENIYYIHPDEPYLNSTHRLYKDSDLKSTKSCGSNPASSQLFTGPESRIKRHVDNPIRGPYTANSGSRYLELAFVVDTGLYIKWGRNFNEVYHNCKDLTNIINALYAPLNIFVALVGVEVWTNGDTITINSNSSGTLEQFLRYRREDLLRKIPNDNAQLLTPARFDHGVVGKAAVGSICTFDSSGGVNTYHSTIIGLVAATVAHEIGHNFGMNHDEAHCACAKESCIMGSSLTAQAPTDWSSCSLEQLSLSFSHGMDYCLRNKPRRLFQGPVCGNDFVEPGEECDCGPIEHCKNPCCNPETCTLKSKATCATGECCNLQTCRLRSRGFPCRPAQSECDLPEFCLGTSEYCPNDVHKFNGAVCQEGKAFCYEGLCKSHEDQCRLLWGPSASSLEACYELNEKGSSEGDCGYDKRTDRYVPCRADHRLCGKAQCNHLDEVPLQFGTGSAAKVNTVYSQRGVHIQLCKSAIVDLGVEDYGPGMVPNGAKCGNRSMCVEQKCLNVDGYLEGLHRSTACLEGCHGNGVCNTLGNCHCDRGFQPPDCVEIGGGGSEDSGPLEDHNDGSNAVATILYVIFLGIVPAIALISLVIWCKRNNPHISILKNVHLPACWSSTDWFQSMTSSITSRLCREARRPSTVTNQARRVNAVITDKSFVSSTNPDAIKFSRNIRAEGFDPTAQVMGKNEERMRTKPATDGRTVGDSNDEPSDYIYESNSELYANAQSHALPDTSVPNIVNHSQNLGDKFFYLKKPPPPPKPSHNK